MKNLHIKISLLVFFGALTYIVLDWMIMGPDEYNQGHGPNEYSRRL